MSKNPNVCLFSQWSRTVLTTYVLYKKRDM